MLRARSARGRPGDSQFAAGGGEYLVCAICFNARKLDECELVANARLGGATPLWQ